MFSKLQEFAKSLNPCGIASTSIATETEDFLQQLRRHFEHVAQDFNAATEDEAIKVRLSQLASAKQTGSRDRRYIRFLVSTAFWALSVRGLNGHIEIYKFPSTELLLPGNGESPPNLRVRFEKQKRDWTVNGAPVGPAEIEVLCKTLFRDVVTSSYRDAHAVPEYVRLPLLAGDESFVGRVKRLVAEKNNLLRRVVTEQERTQRQISRDLHDAVISDLMALCSSLSTSEPPATAVIIERIEHVITELRSICQGLSPRDLKDWGLQTVIGDMLNAFGERTGIDCTLESSGAWPSMPEDVEIHVFRITQECLNNVEKHAQAKRVSLNVQLHAGEFQLSVRDDGRGFVAAQIDDARACGGAGLGTDIIRERVDLIRQHYPAAISIDSEIGRGSKVTLVIKLEPDNVRSAE